MGSNLPPKNDHPDSAAMPGAQYFLGHVRHDNERKLVPFYAFRLEGITVPGQVLSQEANQQIAQF
jgi:hypothetical protein